ncbi:hypothetical protein BU16DRAFT_622424 [Lophium mytilinum]|uniref:Uncharacterized protein n=1 Tax=Lophium mytilinum TaxID=390894 RepID=A0A6A6QBG9_9PEZI|nr:hypothetical protein BU16DRAFT_622424 [Lophium mytilinum]
MHQDAGNTGSSDYGGPLGNNVNVSTIASGLRVLLFDTQGELTAAYTYLANGSKTPTYALAAVDPDSFAILSTWLSPGNDHLNTEYMELNLKSNTIAVSSRQGRIFIVQRKGTQFNLLKTIDLVALGIVEVYEELLNSMFDAQGNIWFSTGGIVGGVGDAPQNTTVFGYIDSKGTVHSLRLQNQMQENGLAVNGDIVYAATGPSPNSPADTANATGYIYAFTSGSGSKITTLWKEAYDAGSAIKPGCYSRGTGATPTLLGNDYVVITDNSDSQISLLVYRQGKTSGPPVCSVPVFQPGTSATDNSPIIGFDGKTYGVILRNDYNAPALYLGAGDINGAYNNFNPMAPGLVRVNVPADGGGCSIAWSNDEFRTTSVSVLSTKTGLFYTYLQDAELADQGEYVFYASATSYETGEVAWKVRAGAGGTLNDNELPGTLGPDGTFYQGVTGGVVRVHDSYF